MSIERHVASLGIRIGTVAVTMLCAAAIARAHSPSAVGVQSPTIAAWVFGIATAIGAIHSFHRAYSFWMQFTAVLHQVAVSLLFGACYLVIVPVFVVGVRIADPLGLRRRRHQDTYWVKRRTEFDFRDAQRMG